jgi:elongation factor Ts
MMDCKKALVESNGDFEAAEVYLRNKGLISADKKASRLAAEGAVVAYVHTGSRVGVLMEVNCESDFVARGEAFKEFAEDMAMQVGPSVVFPNLRQDCQKGGTGRTRFSGFFSWVSRSA